jgi:protein-disulfide isomerase
LPLLEQVLKKYPNKVKVVFKQFPLRNHKYAMKAAAAALAAERQGKFWDCEDRLFKNFNRLSDQKIQEIARELGLDDVQFQKDMHDTKILAKINQDIQDGKNAGVRGTPTVFVDGRLLRQRSMQGFQTMIDKELKKMDRENK